VNSEVELVYWYKLLSAVGNLFSAVTREKRVLNRNVTGIRNVGLGPGGHTAAVSHNEKGEVCR